MWEGRFGPAGRNELVALGMGAVYIYMTVLAERSSAVLLLGGFGCKIGLRLRHTVLCAVY